MGIASMDRVKKVLVTGVCGQLGHDVANELLRRGYDVIGSDIKSEKEFAATDCMTRNRCKERFVVHFGMYLSTYAVPMIPGKNFWRPDQMLWFTALHGRLLMLRRMPRCMTKCIR